MSGGAGSSGISEIRLFTFVGFVRAVFLWTFNLKRYRCSLVRNIDTRSFYYFGTDRLDQLIPIFTRNLMLGEYIHRLPAMEVVRLTILSAILLVALYQLSLRYSLLIVSQRRGILALVSMLIFLSLTFVVIPVDYYDFMYMFALPLAFLYAYYFISNRLILVGNVFFILLLAACLLTCWV